MRLNDLAILASRPGAGDIIEILIGLAVFLIWVIGSIVGAVKKRRGQAEQPETADEAVIVLEPPPLPMPPQPARRKPKLKPRASARVAVAELEPSPRSAYIAVTPEVTPDRMTDANANRVSKSATATRRLLRPDTIRGGVVLSELLQPPVSLRPPRDLSA